MLLEMFKLLLQSHPTLAAAILFLLVVSISVLAMAVIVFKLHGLAKRQTVNTEQQIENTGEIAGTLASIEKKIGALADTVSENVALTKSQGHEIANINGRLINLENGKIRLM